MIQWRATASASSAQWFLINTMSQEFTVACNICFAIKMLWAAKIMRISFILMRAAWLSFSRYDIFASKTVLLPRLYAVRQRRREMISPLGRDTHRDKYWQRDYPHFIAYSTPFPAITHAREQARHGAIAIFRTPGHARQHTRVLPAIYLRLLPAVLPGS